MKLQSVFKLIPHLSVRYEAVAFSGLLVIDYTILILTIARSLRLWTRKEPFLHRLFIDSAFRGHLCHLVT